ncbi:MAG: hypothetical protein RL641_92 [Candidatus Parcubacteria bacterium]|jgi:hypothetical protein
MVSYSKKFLSALLILSFIISPALYQPKVASAGFFDEVSGGDILVTALGCSGLLDKASSALTFATDSLAGALTGEVPVGDSGTHGKEGCLDSIAYTASKLVLAKITKSTLNWINSGFSGAPTFVQDPGSFFTSVADETVSSFTAEIAFDPARFPFGRLTAQNIINSIKGQLDHNAQVSSGNLLNNDGDTNKPYKERFDAFTSDFLYGGGWDGYLAVTQISNANPFTSYIQAVNNVGPVVNDAQQYSNPVQQITKELEQSGGFLALKKCINPTDYEPASADPSFDRAQATAQAQNDPNDPDTALAKTWLRKHTCAPDGWETKTPGTAIAQQMHIALGNSNQQLLLADEINESISAIFDALIKQLFNKGVASLTSDNSNPGGTNVQTLGGYGTNSNASTLGNTSGTGNAEADQWYNQNQNFDLKLAIYPANTPPPPIGTPLALDTDCFYNPANPNDPNFGPTSANCDGGLITMQYVYADALGYINSAISNVVKWINLVDYCVPGPRPDWFQTAQTAVQDLGSVFSDLQAEDIAAVRRAQVAQKVLQDFTGYTAQLDQNPLNAYNAIWQTLKTMYGGVPGYKEQIADRYDLTLSPWMPSMSILAKQEYNKKANYNNVLTTNTEAIGTARAMARRLENMYIAIKANEAVNNIGNNPTPAQQTSFDAFMKNQLRIFSRLVVNLKSAPDVDKSLGDIALADQEVDYLADYDTGLFRSCLTEIGPVAQGGLNPAAHSLTRRHYKEALPIFPADFANHGWNPAGTTPYSLLPQSSSFLNGIVITAAHQLTTDVYIGHYTNAGGPDVDFGTGIFEDHINAY